MSLTPAWTWLLKKAAGHFGKRLGESKENYHDQREPQHINTQVDVTSIATKYSGPFSVNSKTSLTQWSANLDADVNPGGLK